MEIVLVDLDKLKHFIDNDNLGCNFCEVVDTKIDCPYKSGAESNNRCNDALLEYLTTTDKGTLK